MIYSKEVENMCSVCKGAYHGPAPIPEEGKWVAVKEIKEISGYTHGIGWCAPQQGACKLSLNVKDGIIQEALVETIGCTGMTHSAAMASEILPGKTILEALNTDLVCDAINTAMRELFLQIVYGRTQSAFSEGGLAIGAGLEDLGKVFVHRLVRSMALLPRVPVIWSSPRVTSPSSISTRTTRFAVMNMYTSERLWKPSRTVWTPMRLSRRTPVPMVVRLRSRVQLRLLTHVKNKGGYDYD